MSLSTHQAASVELTDFPIAPEQIIAGDPTSARASLEEATAITEQFDASPESDLSTSVVKLRELLATKTD